MTTAPADLVRTAPLRGVAAALTASLLFAVNGTVSKTVLESGLSSLRLVELRSQGLRLGGLGVLAGLGAAVSLAAYCLTSERGLVRRDPLSLAAWTSTASAVFWSVLQPWWTFPWANLTRDVVVPWVVLGEALSAVQPAGATVVLTGILLAETAR